MARSLNEGARPWPSGWYLSGVQRVVWDWNGTLFDDLHVVVEAVNRGIAPWGVAPITLEDYRDHYTRPVRDFYSRIFGRTVSEAEWTDLDRRFHAGYTELLDRAVLNGDALAALERVASAGVPQSLLSMFPHEELLPIVERMGIAGYFDRIDGLRGPTGGMKAAYLEAHLLELIGDLDPAEVLVVGDTPDDAMAAAHVGAGCVLFDNGSHHREELEATGAPVVTSLREAVAGILPPV